MLIDLHAPVKFNTLRGRYPGIIGSAVNKGGSFALVSPVNGASFQVELPHLLQWFSRVYIKLFQGDICCSTLGDYITDPHEHADRLHIFCVIGGKPARGVSAIGTTRHANPFPVSSLLFNHPVDSVSNVVKFFSCRVGKSFHGKG